MPKRRFFQIPLAIVATPFLFFAVAYALRWVTTGQWVPGGGDRAIAGMFIAMLLLAPVAISEIES